MNLALIFYDNILYIQAQLYDGKVSSIKYDIYTGIFKLIKYDRLALNHFNEHEFLHYIQPTIFFSFSFFIHCHHQGRGFQALYLPFPHENQIKSIKIIQESFTTMLLVIIYQSSLYFNNN